MNTQRLIKQFVGIAKRHSKDAREDNLKDLADPTNLRHFYNFLRARAVRSAYMHAARLVKQEQKSAVEKMRHGKAAKRWLRAFKEEGYPPHKPNNLEMHEA